ncbi:MAG: hypothetical protein KC553_03345 [Nitrospina sp.]|nr:hypothetical protein [Nitrospina sp.]
MENRDDKKIPEPGEKFLLEDQLLPTQPFDLKESLKIRDGLKGSRTLGIPRHVLQEIYIRAMRSRSLCLN